MFPICSDIHGALVYAVRTMNRPDTTPPCSHGIEFQQEVGRQTEQRVLLQEGQRWPHHWLRAPIQNGFFSSLSSVTRTILAGVPSQRWTRSRTSLWTAGGIGAQVPTGCPETSVLILLPTSVSPGPSSPFWAPGWTTPLRIFSNLQNFPA